MMMSDFDDVEYMNNEDVNGYRDMCSIIIVTVRHNEMNTMMYVVIIN